MNIFTHHAFWIECPKKKCIEKSVLIIWKVSYPYFTMKLCMPVIILAVAIAAAQGIGNNSMGSTTTSKKAVNDGGNISLAMYYSDILYFTDICTILLFRMSTRNQIFSQPWWWSSQVHNLTETHIHSMGLCNCLRLCGFQVLYNTLERNTEKHCPGLRKGY